MCLLCWRRTLLARGMNMFCASDEPLEMESNVLKTRIQTFATHTQLATSDFQIELISRWLLLTGTHLRKRMVAITLSYSPLSTLHPQVIYAITFFAGTAVWENRGLILNWLNHDKQIQVGLILTNWFRVPMIQTNNWRTWSWSEHKSMHKSIWNQNVIEDSLLST